MPHGYAYTKAQAERDKKKKEPKTKRVTKDGKVFTVTSTDGGKTWTNPQPYTGKAGWFSQVQNPFKKSEKSSKKSNLKIKGTPGSTPGALAAKKMAKERRDAGKSTLGDFGSGPDRGKKAAQAAAKARIADQKKNPNKYKVKKKKKVTTWRDME